jgi:hypothetical protein
MCGIEKEYKTRGTYTKPMKKNELSFSIIIGKTYHIAGVKASPSPMKLGI